MKIKAKEKEYLQRFNDENYYIARNKNNDLQLFHEIPEQGEMTWFYIWKMFGDIYGGVILNKNLLTFITWESGKAWSKAELMELEVAE